jgi:hypothetical protein
MSIQEIQTPRRRGRPVGSGYQRVDKPLWQEMHRLLEECREPTPEAAARAVADRAYPLHGGGSKASRITRLAKGYRRYFTSYKSEDS